MNNLNLLFDYRGTISAQQFKRGIYIVFLICLLSIILKLFRTLDHFVLADKNWSVEQRSIETLFYFFTPSLIYFSFILLYSSLVLGIKRGRTLKLSLLKRNTFGILIFLFFNIVSVIATFIFPIIISPFPEENYYSEMEIAYGVIALLCVIAIIGGTFIIAILSKEKTNELNYSLNKINYLKLIPLFIFILLVEVVFLGGISFMSSGLSPIKQTFIKELKDVVIYILAAWIAFRIIIPNNKETNTQISLFDNQIIRLLFDWRGKITKREFWCGAVIIFFCALHLAEGTVWQEIESIAINKTYHGEGFMSSTTLISLLSQFIPSFFPYGCIVFYSSILICIKRCRALHLNTFLGYIVGISSYLSITSIQAFSHLTQEIDRENPYFNLLVGCILLFFITLFINIIGIIMLSQSTNNDLNYTLNNNNSIQYIINNGWLILSYIAICLIMRFLRVSMGSDLYLIITAIVYLMYIVIFIFLSMDKLHNAGLSRSLSPLIVVLYFVSLITYYGLYEYGFFIGSPKAYALGRVETSLATTCMSAFYFILFLLPSKYQK